MRANAWGGSVELVRTSVASEECRRAVNRAKPEIVIGNACRKFDDQHTNRDTTRNAQDILDTFLATRAQILVMECPTRFNKAETWAKLKQQLEGARCAVQIVTLSAEKVGVPTGRQRRFIAAVRTRGDSTVEDKLVRWKRRVEGRLQVACSLGEFLGREGVFFLRRGPEEKGIFSFDEIIPALTHKHIMGRKPQEADYKPHEMDAGPVEVVQELDWEDFIKLTTAQETFCVPRTLRRTDAARLLEDFTLPPMLQEIFLTLGIDEIAKRHAGTDDTTEEELLLGTASLSLEPDGEVTALGSDSQRRPPRFKVTPAVLRSATRRIRNDATVQPREPRTSLETATPEEPATGLTARSEKEATSKQKETETGPITGK